MNIITVAASNFAAGHNGKCHSCASAQPIHPVQGVMSLHTSRGKWTVAPRRACWLAANEPHRVETRCGFEMFSIYTSAEDRDALLAESGIVSVSELLHAAIIALGIA